MATSANSSVSTHLFSAAREPNSTSSVFLRLFTKMTGSEVVTGVTAIATITEKPYDQFTEVKVAIMIDR